MTKCFPKLPRLIAFAAAFVLAGCVSLWANGQTENAATGTSGPAMKQTTLAKIKEQGYISVGFANEDPYGYADSSGKLTGESPEIARYVIHQIDPNVKLQGVLTEFGSLIPGLQAGRFDMVAAGMFITPKRCQQVTFANPNYTIGEALLVAKGNPKNLHSYEDIAKNPNAKLAVESGAVEGGYAKDVGVKPDQLVEVPDPPSGLAAVATGRADAFSLTSVSIQQLVMKSGNQKVEVADPFNQPIINGSKLVNYGGFAFRKDETALVKAVNDQLATFIGSSTELNLVKPFGFTKVNVPPAGLTSAQICGGQG
ncbi:MAG TPA: ectoine/hydroxyectoine ABC transporter substrate-binding protein EhuB [Spirochaetia bacterium]|nr:ectoine/hydroxyectoine ABC transporter substrate-binding protein EhuB [Spirochaetia bacterium]